MPVYKEDRGPIVPPSGSKYICDGQAFMAAIWCVTSDHATCSNELWNSKVQMHLMWNSVHIEQQSVSSPTMNTIYAFHQRKNDTSTFWQRGKIAIYLSKAPSGRLFCVHLFPARNS